MNSEQLIKVLASAGVELMGLDDFGELNEDLGLNRDLGFSHNGEEFNIEWFANMMTLSHKSGINVMFDKVEHSGTWPNHFKRNLQFKANGNVVAVIGIEPYKRSQRVMR